MRRLALGLALVSWLSLAEWKIFERLLYTDSPSVDFVLESVRGVLAGTPVSRSWQHRFLGPLAVAGLSRLTGDRRVGLELFHGLMLLAANLLLFWLLRRQHLRNALLALVAFGFAHLLLTYKLEYPWDWIDLLIFLTFGSCAARGGSLLAMVPLLVIGAFNHETILYVPLWFLLSTERKQRLGASAALAALGGAILAMRKLFYQGQPNLPGQVFEAPTPLLDNHFHLSHNLTAVFGANWISGRIHLSLFLLGAITVCAWLAIRSRRHRRTAAWSLIVIATILCFGYTNETRHYLPLVAFLVPSVALQMESKAVLP